MFQSALRCRLDACSHDTSATDSLTHSQCTDNTENAMPTEEPKLNTPVCDNTGNSMLTEIELNTPVCDNTQNTVPTEEPQLNNPVCENTGSSMPEEPQLNTPVCDNTGNSISEELQLNTPVCDNTGNSVPTEEPQINTPVCGNIENSMPTEEPKLNTPVCDNTGNSVPTEELQLNTPLCDIADVTIPRQSNLDTSFHDDEVPSCNTETGTKSPVIDDSDASVVVALNQSPADTASDFSESVVPSAPAGSESIPVVSAASATTEAGSKSSSGNQMTEASVDNTEADTKTSGDLLAATVVSCDEEDGTESTAGHYVRKPVSTVNCTGNLKTTPKMIRRLTDAADVDVNKTNSASASTDAGLTSHDKDSSNEQAISEEVSMDCTATASESLKPVTDKKTPSPLTKPARKHIAGSASPASKPAQQHVAVSGSASVPSTPQYVSSEFCC